MRSLAPPHLLLAAYCGGLCLALVWQPSAALLVCAGLSAAAGLFLGRRAPALPGRVVVLAGHRALVVTVSLMLLFAVAGVALGGARLAALGRSTLAAYAGHHVPLAAVLTDLPAEKNGEVTLAVRVTSVAGVAVREPAHLRLHLEEGQTLGYRPTGPLTEGALLRLPSASVEPLPSPKPGAFDYGRYLRRRGEHALLEADFADLTIIGRRGGLQGLIDRLRLASRAHLLRGVHSPVAEVLQGMVLGDDEGVSQETTDAFRASGLLHIMAVSGENVVLLCAMWSFAFALLGIHRLVRTLMLLPLVATYVVLTGASPSIVRAGVAGVLGLLAILASRPTDGWLLWLAPAAWLLTMNPDNLYDVSFQLSFAAVAGLLLIARPLTRALAFLPGPLPESVGVTTAASISTAPVSILTFGSASLVSIPANAVGGFVLGPIMFLGMLSLLLGFVSEWVSAPLNVLAGLFIGFLLAVSHFFAGLPGAVYVYQGVTLRLVLVPVLVAELGAVAALAARDGGGLPAYVRDRRRWPPLAAATAALLAAALLLSPAPVRPPDRPTLTFLDVGEGAASLLQVPGGPTVLIDAGPTPLGATLRRHGVSRIDVLVLSHGHADHVGGLEDVIGSVKVGTALLPDPPERSAALDGIAARLQATGTVVRRITSAQVAAGNGWSLRVLPTRPSPGEEGNQSENDYALVALVGLAGHEALVPGDAEGEVLEALDLPRCDVVEWPHHGSRGGISPRLLAELDPDLGVISVGPNTYGHPTSESLSTFAGAGVPCDRTDLCGEVAVWADARGLLASAERGSRSAAGAAASLAGSSSPSGG
jgi:competence protein ComEC